MSIEAIGCCGAYCGTCPELLNGNCKGCKLGYASGERDLSKARCRMKVCCVGKELDSCADCAEYKSCDVLNAFLGKNSYKYKKYRQALESIRANGYEKFLALADTWNRQYGKYE